MIRAATNQPHTTLNAPAFSSSAVKAPFSVIVPPEQVRTGLLRLHGELGLVYGAADLAITPDGDWVFFETNQNGEWGWLAEAYRLPVAPAVADLLQQGADTR